MRYHSFCLFHLTIPVRVGLSDGWMVTKYLAGVVVQRKEHCTWSQETELGPNPSVVPV